MQSSSQIIFEGIGTKWEIEIIQPVSAAAQSKLETQIRDCVEQYDHVYSRFRSDSLVTKLAKHGGTEKLPDNAKELFAFYQQLYNATNGKVTPLIGNVLEDAGYGVGYSLKPKPVVRSAPKWDDILSYDYPNITLQRPAALDIGAAGKGHLVDIVAELLRENNITSFVIDASGDILHTGDQPVRIGLEHPHDSSMVVGVAELHNRSLCGSASNRRAWEGLHHIMDPDLATPTRDIIATWAVADTAMQADGFATALFFTSGRHLKQHFDFEYFVVRRDLTFEQSPDFPTVAV